MNNTQSSVRFEDLYGVILETLEKNGSVSFTANGSSMLPFIRGGKDQVSIVTPQSEIQKNDVIFYRRKNGDFVLHRVVRKESDRFILCGDNQYVLEKGVARESVIGILSEVKKNGSPVDQTSFQYKFYLFCLPLRRILLRIKIYFHVLLHKIFVKS